jgi:hypothetical protein
MIVDLARWLCCELGKWEGVSSPAGFRENRLAARSAVPPLRRRYARA